MILRAPFRRTIAIAEMRDVEAEGDQLRFRVGSSAVVLELGPGTAEKWAKKIATPPPSQAQKLGIGPASPAYTIGRIDDPSLVDVLNGHTAKPGEAKMSLAIVRDAEQLGKVIILHEVAMGKAPIWLVHGKGSSAIVGETVVRQTRRMRGYRDTKVSAVSATLSATRYSPG